MHRSGRGASPKGPARKLAFVTASALPDASTPLGRQVRQRLRDDVVVWLTTVGRDGTPQPNPVWFLVEDGQILVYNRPRAARVQHARAGGRVALHLNSGANGNDIVVFTGTAEVDETAPTPDLHGPYVDKYRAAMERVSGSLEAFGRAYPVLIRVHPETTRGF